MEILPGKYWLNISKYIIFAFYMSYIVAVLPLLVSVCMGQGGNKCHIHGEVVGM